MRLGPCKPRFPVPFEAGFLLSSGTGRTWRGLEKETFPGPVTVTPATVGSNPKVPVPLLWGNRCLTAAPPHPRQSWASSSGWRVHGARFVYLSPSGASASPCCSFSLSTTTGTIPYVECPLWAERPAPSVPSCTERHHLLVSLARLRLPPLSIKLPETGPCLSSSSLYSCGSHRVGAQLIFVE